MLRLAVLVLLCGGCAGIESEIYRTKIHEEFVDFLHGGDRGLSGYALTIYKAVHRPSEEGTYFYAGQPNVSSFVVWRSVRGIGGTALRTPGDLAYAVDTLFFVLRGDPVGYVRATAARQLGRIAARYPAPPGPPPESDEGSVVRINQIAHDLLELARKIRKGGKVTQGEVIKLLRSLSQQHPEDLRSAMQMVRAVTSRPIAGTAPGPLKAEADRLVPAMVRECVMVGLRDVACGDPFTPHPQPDPSPFVRSDAADVLAGLAPAEALPAVVLRLADPVDPAERNADVRKTLLDYLGKVGGPAAFRACLVRLDNDVDSGVRLHAYRALRRMTGVGLPPQARDWRAWRDHHPSWKMEEGDQGSSS